MTEKQELPLETVFLTAKEKRKYSSSYLIMFGYSWTLYEKAKWFIKVQHIKTSSFIWLTVRLVDKEIYLDFLSGDADDLNTFKMLYLSEKNKKLFASVFVSKFSDETEDREHYKKWVIKE